MGSRFFQLPITQNSSPMIETLGKNLWILLTILFPGLFTYGAWRLLLLLCPSTVLAMDAFSYIDESGIITLSIIMAIALMQQAVGISIEYLLSLIAKKQARNQSTFYRLFWERFALASTGQLSENGTRIIGNFFLSINIFVGLCMLLIYFCYYENLPRNHWVAITLTFFVAANLLVIIFRLQNALSVIQAIPKKQ